MNYETEGDENNWDPSDMIEDPYAIEQDNLRTHCTIFLGIIRTDTGWEDFLLEEWA